MMFLIKLCFHLVLWHPIPPSYSFPDNITPIPLQNSAPLLHMIILLPTTSPLTPQILMTLRFPPLLTNHSRPQLHHPWLLTNPPLELMLRYRILHKQIILLLKLHLILVLIILCLVVLNMVSRYLFKNLIFILSLPLQFPVIIYRNFKILTGLKQFKKNIRHLSPIRLGFSYNALLELMR